MKGIELSKKFYEEYGKPMLEAEFPQYAERIAVGLVGHGSECFFFDDEFSQDHDFDCGFSLWLTESDKKEIGFKLERAYSRILKEHSDVTSLKSIGGNESKGVHTINEFYSRYVQSGSIPDTLEEWLYTPSYFFAEATNGEVFKDSLGEFTKIRNGLLFGMPEDVRLKKIASCLLLSASTGQYNFKRCILHGENAAAEIAKVKFCEHIAELIYLLNKKHAPYYKWIFKGLENLTVLSNLKLDLEKLLTDFSLTDNEKSDLIEKISYNVIMQLVSENMCSLSGDFLEPYAYEVNNKIKNSSLRNSPIII